MAEKLVLFNYWRSSSSYRVRIALHLKGLDFEYRPVHLVKNGGEQHSQEYLALNPRAEVPFLQHGGFGLSQSVAILHYLERIRPTPALYPLEPQLQARCLEIVEIINSGIQPLHNLAILKALEVEAGFDEARKKAWIQAQIRRGFVSIEKILQQSAGQFCVGNGVSWSDLCLVPQVYAAKRFELPLLEFPKISEINDRCLQLEAFQKSIPENQIDAA